MSTEEILSKRPKATQFHQQTLQAWNPLILMSTVFPFFAGVGSVFILIGVALLMLSMSVKELQIDYTDCKRSIDNNDTLESCAEVVNHNFTSQFPSCICIVPFEIKEPFNGQVYLYYLIQNLYQNHRRYVKSKDNYQLLGSQIAKVTTDCDPYGSVVNSSGIWNYAPCGIVANSLFNDSFHLSYYNQDKMEVVPMTSKGIAWKVDTNILYGTPKSWNFTLRPVNWPKSAFERNNESYKGDEELLVWMRTSPLPDFKKLNRIIQHNKEPFKKGLPAGRYELKIEYAYPVKVFKGKKWVVLSTTSSMGGKNHNMGIMYIVVGIIQLILAIGFGISTFIKREKKEGGKKEIKMSLMNANEWSPNV